MIGDFISNMSGFEKGYDIVMIIWAIVIFCALLRVSKNLSKRKEDTNKAYSKAKHETRIDSTGQIFENTSRSFNKEQHEPARAEFVKDAVQYNIWANLISTLPILGLLGTVIGLIPGLIAVKCGNLEVLYSALSTALSSTAIGLLTSLILKIYVSAGPDAKVNTIERYFEEIDRRYVQAEAINSGNMHK